MTKVTKLALPKSGHVNAIIAGDWHSHHIHKPSVKALGNVADQWDKNNRLLIINGDFLDVEYLMAKQESFKININRQNGIEEYFLPLLEDEMAWGNNMLDQLQKVFKKIIFISGNHDWRIDWFGESKFCPHAYKHHFNLKLGLNLKKRDIDFIGYNNWLDWGALSITHGMFHGTSACKNHFEASGGRNVIFSHVHQFEAKSFRSRGETKRSFSLPAMCHLNPEYIKNTDNNWTNGFASIHMKANGHFNTYVYEIWDDQIILPNGKLA